MLIKFSSLVHVQWVWKWKCLGLGLAWNWAHADSSCGLDHLFDCWSLFFIKNKTNEKEWSYVIAKVVWYSSLPRLEIYDLTTFADKKFLPHPWLLWLSGLSAGLRSERSPGPFLVRAHGWVAGQIPSWGHVRGDQSVSLSCTDVSLPFSLTLFKNK